MPFELNDEQREAAEHKGSPLLVRAGPGSGKTMVIIERIKFLLKDCGLNPAEIMCLTFSNKAAASIREKIEEDEWVMEEKVDVSSMQVSTYHSFCREFLVENIMATGRAMRAGILNRATFLVWGVQNIDRFGFDHHVTIGNNANDVIEQMIDGVSTFSDELVKPEELDAWITKRKSDPSLIKDVEEYDFVHRLDNMNKVYKEYVKFKNDIDAMDYDDLIVTTYNILSDDQNKHLLQGIRSKYRHILVDEFQDNNFAQFSLVELMTNAENFPLEGGITAVGDPDQNIYRFQGAYTEIFNHFRKKFTDHKDVFLSKNYRNPEAVINFSSQVIEQDAHREIPPVAFEAMSESDSKVKVVECVNDLAQALFVKEKIIELRKKGYAYNDVAILSRKQRDGLKIAQMLISSGIPVQYVGKTDVHSSHQAKVVFAILRIISDPMNSMVSITRVLQEYGISEQNISRINQEATRRARYVDDGDYAFDVISDQNVENLSQKNQVKDIHAMLVKLIKIEKDSTISKTLYRIIRNETNVYKKISNDDSIENFIQRSVLSDLIANAYDLETINPEARAADLLEFVEHLVKFDVETERGADEQEAVQVSTVHQSKGLEFKIVFVVDAAARKFPLAYHAKHFYVPPDLAKGVLPAADPKEEFQREERRVLYVGLTRALDHLFVTYPTQYDGNKAPNKASKYIKDIIRGNENVEFEKATALPDIDSSTGADAFEIIRDSRTNVAIEQMRSGQHQSAIESIMDLVKIQHFRDKGSFDGLDTGSYSLKSTDDIEGILEGTISERKKFSRKNLSVSAIEPYENCPKQFWYKEILNVLPENQDKTPLTKGSMFHNIVEDSAGRQIDGSAPEEYDVLEKELEDRWGGEASRAYLYEPLTKEEEDKDSLRPALESFSKWSKINPNRIIFVECEFEIDIGGIPWKGKIDRLEETPEGDLVIVDYKTGGKKKKIGNVNESIQLNVYAIATNIEKEKDMPFGKKLPDGVSLKGKKVARASFFYPEKDPDGDPDPATGKSSGQWFDYEITDEDMANTKAKLEGYVESLRNGEFDATPGEYMPCKWCDYKDICPDSAATSGN